MVAAARVQQAEISVAAPGCRVELDGAHRVRQVLHDVRLAEQFAARSCKDCSGRTARVPLGDDVVVGHILQREARRDEIRRLRIARRLFRVHGVKQPVGGEFGMKDEADEPALEPVVDGVRKCLGQRPFGAFTGSKQSDQGSV